MSTDICRRFILHNDFIPPTDTVHKWDYLAFGYIDGISVKTDLFKRHKWNLNLLWDESIATKEELAMQESRQVIYGFRSEKPEETNPEEEFWQNKGETTNYPFLFFIMIQFEDSAKRNLSGLLENRKAVEEKFTKADTVKGITYLTLDNSDLLLVLRSCSYDDGAGMIDSIHRSGPFFSTPEENWNVKYSFTILAVDKYFLNASNFSLLQGQQLHKAYIYAMESASGSLDEFYNKLKYKLPFNNISKLPSNNMSKQSILGYNDELMLISDISWDKFLNLYKDTTGILNHASPDFQNYVSSLTTIIGFKQPAIARKNQIDLPEGNAAKLKIQKSFFDVLHSKLAKLDQCNFHSESLKDMLLSLHYLVNSLSKFENSFISENLVFPSAFSIYLLVDILLEIFGGQHDFFERICYQDYSRFLNSLNSYAQNPVRSDRQFTQTIEFNVRTYNLPIKLNAFYSAFIFCVRELLNKSPCEKHRYEFLTYPGASSITRVDELFTLQSTDKRLFLVNIPKNQAYNLEMMMIILCHEIGHFVGGSVRKRQSRTKYLIHALARMVSLFYRNRISLLSGSEYDNFWQKFEKKLSELISKEYHYYNTDIHKYSNTQHNKIIQHLKEQKEHSVVITEILMDAAINIIKKKKEILFSDAKYECYMNSYRKCHNKDLASKVRSAADEAIYQVSIDIVKTRTRTPKDASIKSMLDILISICKEGLSDIIAIMTLELNQEQYAAALLENANVQRKKDPLLNHTVSEVIVRASLVMVCMAVRPAGKESCYSWDSDWIFSEDTDIEIGIFFNNLDSFIDQFITGHGQFQLPEEEKINVVNFFHDRRLLRFILKYLSECRKACAMLIEEKKDAQKKIKDIFEIAQSDTVESAMLQIESTINEYREQIQKKMTQIVDNQQEYEGT